MKIIFTESVVDEDGVKRDVTNLVKEIYLWKNHRYYNNDGHSRSGQSDLLIISNVGSGEGWFLSFSRFRSFLKTGIIKIIK